MLNGGDDAVIVIGMEIGKYRGGILAHGFGRNPVNVADSLTGVREAGAAIGAQLVLVNDSGDAGGDMGEPMVKFTTDFICPLLLSDVAGGGKHTGYVSGFIPIHGGVIQHRSHMAIAVAHVQSIVVYRSGCKGLLITRPCRHRVGKISAELGAN